MVFEGTMSVEVTKETMSQTTVAHAWEPPIPPSDLIFDDGEPLATNRHRMFNTFISPVPKPVNWRTAGS